MNREDLRDLRKDNRRIRQAIRSYLAEESEDTAGMLTVSLIEGRVRDIPLLASVEATDEDGNRIDLLERSQQDDDDEESGEEVSLQVGTLCHRADDGTEEGNYLPVYTDLTEFRKSGDPMTSCCPNYLEDILRLVSELEIDGLVLNPYSDDQIQMPRETAESILKTLEENFLNQEDEDEDEDGNIGLILGDITELEVDAVVNAANNTLLGGSGVDGAIHRAAGPELLAECRALHGCATGRAKITKGYNLPAKHVIHTVGPIYSGVEEDAALLGDCYWNSLDLAADNDLHSIAFPCISTGRYGYPKKEAAEIAIETVLAWLDDMAGYDIRVTFCVHDEETFGIYQNILDELLENADD